MTPLCENCEEYKCFCRGKCKCHKTAENIHSQDKTDGNILVATKNPDTQTQSPKSSLEDANNSYAGQKRRGLGIAPAHEGEKNIFSTTVGLSDERMWVKDDIKSSVQKILAKIDVQLKDCEMIINMTDPKMNRGRSTSITRKQQLENIKEIIKQEMGENLI